MAVYSTIRHLMGLARAPSLVFLATALAAFLVVSLTGPGHSAGEEPTLVAAIRLGPGAGSGGYPATGHDPYRVAVNPVTNRVYTVGGDRSLVAIDGLSNAVLASVPVAWSPRDVAVNPNTDRVYVIGDDFLSGDGLSVIDGENNLLIATVPIWGSAVAVDDTTNRIYVVGLPFSNEMAVIDGFTNAIVASVPLGMWPNAVAVNTLTGRIYVSHLGDDTVSVIDGATNTVVATVPVGDDPYDVAVNPATNMVYVANYLSDDMTVIDGAEQEIVTTVPVGWRPYGVGVNPTTGLVYVANGGDFTVSVLDGEENVLLADIPVERKPIGVAVNSLTETIYVSGGGAVSVIDGATETLTVTIRVATWPLGVAVNPETGRAYVANTFDESLAVIDGATNTVIETVELYDAPFAVEVDPTTNRIYVTHPWSDTLSVIDGANNTPLDIVLVGPNPRGLALNPVTSKLYLANGTVGTVTVLDIDVNAVVATINVGVNPYSVDVNPYTDRIYVTDPGWASGDPNASLWVIDGTTDTVEAEIKIPPTGPVAVAVNPSTNRIYATQMGSSVLTVIDGGTNAIIASPVIGWGWDVAVNPATNRIYVPSISQVGTPSAGVSILDGETNIVVARVSLETRAAFIGSDPWSGRIYATSPGDDTVYVIQDIAPPPPTPEPPTPEPEPLTYLATGDSIPAGADLTGKGWKKQRYPAVLCAELKSAGPTQCSNISKTGHTTDDYLKKQLIKAVKAQPDLITVTVGADDILASFLPLRLFRDCDIPASTANLRGILNSLLQHTDALVVVTGYYNPVNPSNNDPFRLYPWGTMEACVLEGNNAIHEVLASLSSTWPDRLVEVPLYEKFKEHEFGTSDSWIASCGGQCGWFAGGIHPNKAGQTAIAEAIIHRLGH